MSRTIHCVKLDKEAEGIAFAPYPGDLGQRIFDNISQEAWQMWLNHQTMLINERQLSLMDPEARKYLEGEMEKFLFGGEYDKIEGYVPEE
jgi:Fe-S cluster biosynthesis and repair protein YggX